MTPDIKILFVLVIGMAVFTVSYYLYKRHRFTRSRMEKLEAEKRCLEEQNDRLSKEYDEIRAIVNAKTIDNFEALEAFKLLTKTALEYEGKSVQKHEIIEKDAVKPTN